MYDPVLGRFISLDPLADHPNLVQFSPYVYAVDNPILHNDPTGKCPPWLCGALAGAAVEAGSQYVVNLTKGQGWFEAAANIDGADVAAAAVEGGVTAGASVARRLLVGAATEVVKAGVDFQLDGDADVYLVTEDSEKSFEQIATETAIGVGASGLGEGIDGALRGITNTKHIDDLDQVQSELRRSMNGSQGQADRLSREADLTSTIKGNETTAAATATVISKTVEENVKSSVEEN